MRQAGGFSGSHAAEHACCPIHFSRRPTWGRKAGRCRMMEEARIRADAAHRRSSMFDAGGQNLYVLDLVCQMTGGG